MKTYPLCRSERSEESPSSPLSLCNHFPVEDRWLARVSVIIPSFPFILKQACTETLQFRVQDRF